MIGITIAVMAFIICLLVLIIGFILLDEYEIHFFSSINITIIPTITFPNILSSEEESNCVVLVAFPIFGTVAIDKKPSWVPMDKDQRL